MKALVKAHDKPGLWLQDVPKPEPGPEDVLIKVNEVAICGTDLHIYNWDEWAQEHVPVPMVIGHEYIGVVDEIGELVHSVKVGDRVSGEGHIMCGECRNCRAGRGHLCRDTRGVGVNRPGAFAEYVCHPGRQRLQDPEGNQRRYRVDSRPARQRRAHRAVFRPGRRGRADHRRRADRPDGDRGRRATSARATS